MILVRLKGGLGNQLFQYATARRLALARNAELVLDTSWYAAPPGGDTPRAFELSHFRTGGRAITPAEARRARLCSGKLLSRLPLPRPWKLYRERGFAFDPKVLDLPDNTYLDGYWQSPRYFDDIADIIRAEFQPHVPPGSEDARLAALMAGSNSVSVHVRRGDYVHSAVASSVHGTCSLDYYRRAVEYVVAETGAAHFFVISDDPVWSRENLVFPGPTAYIGHNGPATAFQDLRLMSLCRHNIVANSSFSWWGAWLNANPAKRVIAPRNWFVSGQPTADLVPESWIRL